MSKTVLVISCVLVTIYSSQLQIHPSFPSPRINLLPAPPFTHQQTVIFCRMLIMIIHCDSIQKALLLTVNLSSKESALMGSCL